MNTFKNTFKNAVIPNYRCLVPSTQVHYNIPYLPNTPSLYIFTFYSTGSTFFMDDTALYEVYF